MIGILYLLGGIVTWAFAIRHGAFGIDGMHPADRGFVGLLLLFIMLFLWLPGLILWGATELCGIAIDALTKE